jgi:hypothetical protein
MSDIPMRPLLLVPFSVPLLLLLLLLLLRPLLQGRQVKSQESSASALDWLGNVLSMVSGCAG